MGTLQPVAQRHPTPGALVPPRRAAAAPEAAKPLPSSGAEAVAAAAPAAAAVTATAEAVAAAAAAAAATAMVAAPTATPGVARPLPSTGSGGTANAEAAVNKKLFLMKSAANGKDERLRQLIDANADVEAATDDGRTPLIFAASHGHAACLRVLIEAKANVQAASETGSTALMLCAKHGHAACLRQLLEAQADSTAVDNSGDGVLAYVDAGADAERRAAVLVVLAEYGLQSNGGCERRQTGGPSQEQRRAKSVAPVVQEQVETETEDGECRGV